MITLIETKNFRSLKYIHQPMDKFHVLIGANASGKTTFLDIISFLSDILNKGIDFAIRERTSNFNDLTFSSRGGDIEIAIEADLPQSIIQKLGNKSLNIIRYELRFGLDTKTKEHAIKEERAILIDKDSIISYQNSPQRTLFPVLAVEPKSIVKRKYRPTTYKTSITKKLGGNDNFYDETYKSSGKGWMPSFKLGIKRSALGNLPADATKFPASTWLKDFLIEGVQLFILDSLNIRRASPPGQTKKFKADGSNLPWVIEELKKDESKFNKWISHIKTALPDVQNIITIEREDDKHRYLQIEYDNNIKVPSWLVSDGTLRLLALTLPAYLPDFLGVYLIEEPENGIHPKAIETVYQSLSSVYNSQILIASHSPVILSMVNPGDVLCFAKTKEGVTDAVNGENHPLIKNWQGNINISELFASGILG